MPKIHPCLWFDSQAEEAARFYVSVFPNSRITSVARYDESSVAVSGRPVGSVLCVEFVLDGQTVLALNGGPHFRLSEAASLVVPCRDQAEIDSYWAKLASGGGEEGPCGWLKDRYGLSWQVVPADLLSLLDPSDPQGAERVMKAIHTMRKLDLAALRRARDAG